MDPERTLEDGLFWYKLAVWMWAVLWPATLVFSLWQVLVAGHLSAWEAGLMALVLGSVAQSVFIVGHEMIHRLSPWERRFGEFLLSSVSCPHYVTEHIYIHHALVGTPGDIGSAPKGQSFWHYVPREVASNLTGAWRVQRDRLARRHLPVWHYTNPFWRYAIEVAFWYGLIWWMGGAWSVAIFAVLCLGVVFSMKISNYLQHYGLRRIRLPSGKFERVQPWHSWSAARKVDNWLDNEIQSRVMANLAGLTSTRIVIAHRLSTLRHADRIYVMRSGKVVQEGTFAELSGTEGVFRDLVRRQMA